MTTDHIMLKNQISNVTKIAAFLSLVTALSVATPTGVQASGGGGGGGGSVKVTEYRVTGFVTAIDYAAGTITIGASYYGSGSLTVNSDTKYSVGTSGGFEDIHLGDWAEARYIFSGGVRLATKITAGASSSI